jgi:hypothetical protein
MPSGKAARDLQIFDPVLTEVARQFRPSGYIYNDVCPTINVATISGQYPVFDERYFFSNADNNKMSDREETPELEFAWSTDSYLCEDYGFKVSITPRERQQAVEALRLEASKVQYLMTQMANQREKRLAAVLRKTGTGVGQLTGGAGVTGGGAGVFATATTIEADIKTAKLAVYNLTGMTPNTMILPYKAAYDMATNPTLRDIFKYTVNGAAEAFIQLGSNEEILLPKVFHGLRILIPKGVLAQTGHEGAASSLTDVWGTSARIIYVDQNAGWGIPSTVYQFQHPVLSGTGAAGAGAVVDRWDERDPRRDLIRAMECVDEKVCAGALGYELTGVTT